MLSDVDAQQAQVALDQATYDRNASLVGTEAPFPRQTYDTCAFHARSTHRASSHPCVSRPRCNSPSSPATPTFRSSNTRNYLQAKAQVDEAQRQLDHTVVKAPFAGIVTHVPSIAPGKYLAASTTAFYLVATDHVWVDATPKETELTYVRPGQPVTVTVDTYPDVEWRGVVESISPAAAQQFSLLPAQNTSGNWVKVVQRIPVRVRVDTSDKDLPPLRAGMSVVVDVATGSRPGLATFPGRVVRPRPRGSRDAGGARAGWRQPGGDHRLRDPRHAHAGARHDHRQCRAALYAGQCLGEPGSDRLGADLLYRRCRDHDAADWFPRGAVRDQAPVPCLRRRLHCRVDAVRHGAILGADRAVPDPARRVRRRARPTLADRAVQHQYEGAAGVGDGAMGRRGDGRSRSWARYSAAG